MGVAPIHTPSNSAQDLLLSIPSSTHVINISYLFANGHSNKYGVISLVLLICIFLVIIDVEHLVIYLLAICMSYLGGKCLFHKAVAYILFTVFQYAKLSCLSIHQ